MFIRGERSHTMSWNNTFMSFIYIVYCTHCMAQLSRVLPCFTVDKRSKHSSKWYIWLICGWKSLDAVGLVEAAVCTHVWERLRTVSHWPHDVNSQGMWTSCLQSHLPIFILNIFPPYLVCNLCWWLLHIYKPARFAMTIAVIELWLWWPLYDLSYFTVTLQ